MKPRPREMGANKKNPTKNRESLIYYLLRESLNYYYLSDLWFSSS